MASLQNGAKLFVNYCLNCHSANSMRYSKLTEIGLTDDEIKKNLLFTSDKIGNLMTIALTKADGKQWFGAAPPDLSVIARAKSTTMGPSGVDYVYTFLRSFYRDTSKKTGWDNALFPSVAMPHVLWQLQGPRTFTRSETHPVEKDGAQRSSDHHDLQRCRARLFARRENGRDDPRRRRPDRPDQDSAQDRAAIVAGPADDEHRPDLEGQHRLVVFRRDEPDEMSLDCAGQAHDGAAQRKGLQTE